MGGVPPVGRKQHRPAIRRFRFDGGQIFEVGVKLAINNYKDKLEDGSVGYVTWNRLYRPNKGYWDRVLVGPAYNPLYQSTDLAQVL